MFGIKFAKIKISCLCNTSEVFNNYYFSQYFILKKRPIILDFGIFLPPNISICISPKNPIPVEPCYTHCNVMWQLFFRENFPKYNKLFTSSFLNLPSPSQAKITSLCCEQGFCNKEFHRPVAVKRCTGNMGEFTRCVTLIISFGLCEIYDLCHSQTPQADLAALTFYKH